MRDFDGAMKELVREAAGDLFPQIGLREPVTAWLSQELHAPKRQADLIAQLRSGALVHLELQAQNDSSMVLRMLEYYTRIYATRGVMPHQFVLYFGREKMTMPSCVSGPGLAFSFQLVNMRQLDGRKLLASGKAEANLLALLTNQGDPKDVLNRLRHKLRATDESDRIRVKDLFLLLCSLRGHDGRKVIDTMPVDALDIPLVREYWESGNREGEARGEAKGLAEMLVSVLESRFGALPETTRTRIQSASVEQLRAWAPKAARVESPGELLGNG
jgi:hypothetical protein